MRQALVECLANGVNVVGDAAENFAVGLLVKITQRQAVDFLGQLPAHSEGDRLRHLGHQPGLDVAENRTEYVQTDQQTDDPPNCLKVEFWALTKIQLFDGIKLIGRYLTFNF